MNPIRYSAVNQALVNHRAVLIDSMNRLSAGSDLKMPLLDMLESLARTTRELAEFIIQEERKPDEHRMTPLEVAAKDYQTVIHQYESGDLSKLMGATKAFERVQVIGVALCRAAMVNDHG